MCITFESSNYLLVKTTKDWLVARKCFHVEVRLHPSGGLQGKLIAPYERVPYDTLVAERDNQRFLRIIKHPMMQSVGYRVRLFRPIEDNDAGQDLAIFRGYNLGYHASLFTENDLFDEVISRHLYSQVSCAFWLPITFQAQNIQMVSANDVVVDEFSIPLSSKFYLDFANLVWIREQVATEYWLPVLADFKHLLGLENPISPDQNGGQG